MSDTCDQASLETEAPYPQIFMAEWAGNLALLSDALMRVSPPVDKNNKELNNVFKQQLSDLSGALTESVRLHNLCIELEVLSAEFKLTKMGVDEEKVKEVLAKFKAKSTVSPTPVVQAITTTGG